MNNYDDARNAVLSILQDAADTRISKAELQIKMRAYGFYKGVNNNNADRDIRDRVRDLRLEGYPIHTSSSTSGYKYTNNPEELDSVIADFLSRASKTESVAIALIKTKKALEEKVWDSLTIRFLGMMHMKS